MSGSSPIVVFIGSGEASLLERKVLIYSLHKHASRPLDIRTFNGTHDSVEQANRPPQPLGLPLNIKYESVTEFSNYRFLIPSLCGHRGRAIWVDSDTICLRDIAELFDAPMNGAAVLAKSDAYGSREQERWGLSVSLFDCSRCQFDLQLYYREIERGAYSYTDLHQLTPKFLELHPLDVAPLDPNWNVFDRYDGETRLIHYTNLLTQPWKYRGHPYGDLWFRYFDEARVAGYVTDRDIELTLLRSYARHDLLEGNDWTLASLTKSLFRSGRQLAMGRLRRMLSA
jgi:hypothetical protein